MSHLPLPVEPAIAETSPELVLLAEHLDNSPVTAEQIRIATHQDPVLCSYCSKAGLVSKEITHKSHYSLPRKTNLPCILVVFYGGRE